MRKILIMGLLAGLLNLGQIDIAQATAKLTQTYLTSKEAMLLPYVTSAAQKYNVEPQLIMAHIFTESAYSPTAKRHEYGTEYSFGAMQVLRSTAETLAGKKLTETELLDPRINIDLGTKYIKQNLDRYGGNYSDAIAAYNAGSARKNEKGQYVNSKGIPIVQKYVNKVTAALDKYRQNKSPMKYSIAAALPDVVVDILPEAIVEQDMRFWALGGIAAGAFIMISSNRT